MRKDIMGKIAVIFLCCISILKIINRVTAYHYMIFTGNEVVDVLNVSSDRNDNYSLNGVLINPSITTRTEKKYTLVYTAISENDADVVIDKVSLYLLYDGEYMPLSVDRKVKRNINLRHSELLKLYLDDKAKTEFNINTEKLNIDRKKIKGLKAVVDVSVNEDTKTMEYTYTKTDKTVSRFKWLNYI